ncbi:permease [Tundrisphaera lichenicola]|uniref:permease n=1 Tax=Tundrisphaera lichenicola TaxID=2029860 RepID=UPI003EBEB68E
MSSTSPSPHAKSSFGWARRGDVNAFFGLMLDNVGDMILMASLLIGVFGFPREFVLTRMIPGTALGVLVGDLIFTAMAFRLARKSGRDDVTAMPLGLDTPSTFGSVFLVLGPAFVAAKAEGLDPESAAHRAWFVGIAMLLASGIFKLGCATVGGWLRRMVPRAGLLGSLTSIALVLISFLPLIEIARIPVVGLVSLMVILVTLTARWRLPREIPGALAAVVIGCILYYGMNLLGLGPGLGGGEGGRPESAFRFSLPMPASEWSEWFRGSWRLALTFLPVAIPLALATVVGGIDCTESAEAAGDSYPTGLILAADGVATLVGGLFGGVIQSTPYIGHPAYKAMGARAGYTLATALFVGSAGIFGFFGWIFYLLPQSTVFPILIFVGLEITAQSFHATPVRHYPAVVLACVPALAYLAKLAVGQVLAPGPEAFGQLAPGARHWVETVTMLSGGFIVTSLLWGAILAHLIDGRVRPAVACLVLAGVCSLFGVMHSGLPDGPIVTPSEAVRLLKSEGRLESAAFQTPYHWAAAYGGSAILLLVLRRSGRPPDLDPESSPRES